MSKASKLQYVQEVLNGNIKSNKDKILSYIIRNKTATVLSLQVAFKELRYSTITARVSELINDGIIYIKDTTLVNDNNYSILVFEHCELKREYNRKKIRLQKYKSWKKRGEKEFADLIELEKN